MALLEHPLQLIALLFFLSLLPLFVVSGTCFLKIAIVLSLLRNALGIQQIPPNIAIYGLALMLTLFTMAPVGFAIRDNLNSSNLTLESPSLLRQIDTNILAPYRAFLQKNTARVQVRYFSEIGHKIWPQEYKSLIPDNSLLVLIPAFTVSQLVESFKIGLLLYLPFLAIDLIVSNILLAMGMMMVSPMTISLPFKLLIFVLMGGWEKLIAQLVVSFS